MSSVVTREPGIHRKFIREESVWGVTATSPKGRVKTKATKSWRRAGWLARRAIDKGWNVSIEPYFMDVYLFGDDGTLRVVCRRVTPNIAGVYMERLAFVGCNQSGGMVWPHGVPLPEWLSSRPVIEEAAD